MPVYSTENKLLIKVKVNFYFLLCNKKYSAKISFFGFLKNFYKRKNNIRSLYILQTISSFAESFYSLTLMSKNQHYKTLNYWFLNRFVYLFFFLSHIAIIFNKEILAKAKFVSWEQFGYVGSKAPFSWQIVPFPHNWIWYPFLNYFRMYLKAVTKWWKRIFVDLLKFGCLAKWFSLSFSREFCRYIENNIMLMQVLVGIYIFCLFNSNI